jgi:hypothetical protein
MKVKFYPNDIESDVIEIPDDTSEVELSDMACESVADNVAGFWMIVGGGDQEEIQT